MTDAGALRPGLGTVYRRWHVSRPQKKSSHADHPIDSGWGEIQTIVQDIKDGNAGPGNGEAELEGVGVPPQSRGRLSSVLQHPPGRTEKKPLAALS